MKRRHEETLSGYLFLLPSLIILTIFIGYPMLNSFYLSLHKWNGLSETKLFVGLSNYIRLLSDNEFWNAAKNTGVFTFAVTFGQISFGLIIALMVNRKLRGVTFYRTVFFLPVATSTVAVAVMWVMAYNPTIGIVNYFLRLARLPTPQWLQDPNWAMPGIIIMSIWKWVGYHMVIYLAGLQGIPKIYYEAAELDGANKWYIFRNITWPLLAPTTFFLLMISIIGSFQVFDQVYVMTRGGPIKSTEVIVYYLYQHGFRYLEMGYASAVAYVLFAIIFIFTLVQFRYRRKAGFYLE